MADIRIKVAKDKAKLVKALRAGEGSTGPFQTYADVVTFAAAFGFSKKNRVPFEQASRRDPDPIPGDQFKNRGLMDLIAIAETQNPNILSSDEEQIQAKAKIFKEYANGGFEILENQFSGVADISKQILLFVQSINKDFGSEDLDLLSFL
ncbi:DNA phosphorothioation-associated protein 4 [Nodosilinea sp. LEGE 06152]|uniref:DNA phosphorothioation-associated protein 4 n=1 Tax=Nodosilinea sp. LEGE 06152 TaxID=2777966 RepID=UPI00187E3D4B|nr:DNA phosphorothioation-associated protein 4 [Nodosilinea sp. LEGE 06152]MBE9158200.1 DNA phosphorothioation-associated protein 4 [Nodosilinea sp. LEGE 06152]MBE9160647.1 DNA phosphorothioation-associated protein 4 [Nodosilinea sp. LEGE 06152]